MKSSYKIEIAVFSVLLMYGLYWRLEYKDLEKKYEGGIEHAYNLIRQQDKMIMDIVNRHKRQKPITLTVIKGGRA